MGKGQDHTLHLLLMALHSHNWSDETIFASSSLQHLDRHVYVQTQQPWKFTLFQGGERRKSQEG